MAALLAAAREVGPPPEYRRPGVCHRQEVRYRLAMALIPAARRTSDCSLDLARPHSASEIADHSPPLVATMMRMRMDRAGEEVGRFPVGMAYYWSSLLSS